MDNNIQEQLKQNRADQACFRLGTVSLELSDELDWITNPGTYFPNMPQNIRRLDLPVDSLHPFQGIPHPYLRDRRKQMLSAISKIYFSSADLNALLQNTSLSQYQLNYSEIESLFEELRKFEITNSLDAQKHFSKDEKEDSEEYRAELQEKIINAVKEYEVRLNQYLGHLTKTLTGTQGKLFLFVKKLKRWLLRSQKKILEDGDESNVPLKYITVVRNRIIWICGQHPKLSALTIPDLDSSRIDYNTKLSRFLTEIEGILQNQKPPEAQPSRELSEIQETPETEKPEIKGPLHEYPNQNNKTTKPQTTTGWHELSKKQVILLQEELELPHQEKMVLIRLLFEEGGWIGAEDIAEVDDGWSSKTQNDSDIKKTISAVISKLERKLGEQLNITYEKGRLNKLDRPVQRSTGEKGSARYRINLENLEQLPKYQAQFK